jgi:hypothetical protein
MRSTYRTLNDCEIQHNAEVGLFMKPSILVPNLWFRTLKKSFDIIFMAKIDEYRCYNSASCQDTGSGGLPNRNREDSGGGK